MKIDLNCDLGESFGAYKMGEQQEILKYISSVNIACGFHAGDPSVMRETVALAIENNVAIGAHPGLPDLAGFGRREMAISPQEAYDLVVYQIGALQAFVTAAGSQLRHVKPHGALYNMAAKDAELADAIAKAVADVSNDLILFGLAGSELTKAGEAHGLTVAHEVFADRTYQQDGSLTSRTQPNAIITDEQMAVAQVLQMVQSGTVTSVNGGEIMVRADTICLHGDGRHAVEFARALYEVLTADGVEICAV